MRSTLLTLVALISCTLHGVALADGGGPCEVKTESKRGEYKREIKCKDGVGATWRGEWKTEFRDGPCLIKQEAKHDEFKEEIKCDGHG